MLYSKFIKQAAIVSASALSILFSVSTFADMVVIANAHLPINHLSKHQVASLFLGNPVHLKNYRHMHLQAYNQSQGTSDYNQFYQQVLGWGPDQLASYHSQQVFSGNGNSTQSVNTAADAVQLVQHSPLAVAYVNSNQLSQLGANVKVIYGSYTKPQKTRDSGGIWEPGNYSAQRGAAAQNQSQHQAQEQYRIQNQSQNQNQNQHSGQAQHQAVGSSSANTLAGELSALSGHGAGATNQQQPAQIQPIAQSGKNIWTVIANHIQLNDANNARVRQQLLFFTAHPGIVDTMLKNATPYIYYVYQETVKRHMPARFALLPMLESGYNPYAYSSVGAAGLWQMMPGTASSYGLDISWWYDSRRDVMTSTRAALNYLVQLDRQLGSWNLAAAGYDDGQGAVGASIQYNRDHHRPTDYWSLYLPRETANYVPKLLALATIVKDPARYHVKVPFVGDAPEFAAVTLNSQLDLAEAAKFAGVSMKTIQTLNPGMRRYATSPQGKFTLLIPANRVQHFREALDRMAGHTHISWQYHEVRQGETLYKIARDYHTNPDVLRKVNHLSVNYVSPGAGILVPIWLNHTYKKAARYFQPVDDKVVLPVHAVPVMPKVNLNAIHGLSVNDLLNGKFSKGAHPTVLSIKPLTLPSQLSAKNANSLEQKPTVERSASMSPEQIAAMKLTKPIKTQPVKSNNPLEMSGAPISKKDSLKTLMAKIYGNSAQ